MNRDSGHPRSRQHTVFAVALAAAAYLGSLARLQRASDASLLEPLFLLLVLGVAFPLLAWGLTRNPRDAVAPSQERSRLPAVLLYLVVFSLLVLGWGFSAIQQAFPGEPAQSVVQVLAKLLTMVVLPLWLFTRWHQRSGRPFGRGRLLLVFAVMSLAYLALQAVFGRGLQTLAELAPSAATLAWAIPRVSCGRRSKRAWPRKCCSVASCRKNWRSPRARTLLP